MSLTEPRFSIIMTVFDNARELEEHLPEFLGQDYQPGFEVIVVDESSTDDTEDILKLAKQDDPRLYSTFLPKPNPKVTRRKMALTLGVKAAKNDWVVFTDIQRSLSSPLCLKDLSDIIKSDKPAIIMGYHLKKGLKLQYFDETDQGLRLIRKAERKHANGHAGKLMKYLRGKYDFIAVPTKQAHEVLKAFEHDIKGRRLLGLRIAVGCQNLIH